MANIHVASVNGGKVVAGDSRYGFFGEVPVTELWSGDELSKLLGVTEGTLQHSNEPWLKFVLDGKIIYKSKNHSVIRFRGINYMLRIWLRVIKSSKINMVTSI